MRRAALWRVRVSTANAMSDWLAYDGMQRNVLLEITKRSCIRVANNGRKHTRQNAFENVAQTVTGISRMHKLCVAILSACDKHKPPSGGKQNKP